MTLPELKIFLQQNKVISLYDLTMHSHTDAETMRNMLQHWIRKGKVKKVACEGEHPCKECNGCNPLMTEFYQWIEE